MKNRLRFKMNRILSYATINKMHLGLTAIATLNAYLINYFNTICNCSISFVLFLFTINLIDHNFGTTKSHISAWIALTTAFAVQGALPYYIYGQIMPELIRISIVSTTISVGVSLYSSISHSKKNFLIKTWFGIMFAAVVDGVIMSIYFSFIYKYEVVASIFVKEIGYKALWATCIFAMSPILKMIDRR